MRPLLWGGVHSVVVVALEGEPSVGDLLLFRLVVNNREISVVHRLIDTVNEGGETLYITRGDNCINCERIRQADIIGRVAEVHRIGKSRPWHIIRAQQFATSDPAYLRYSRFWKAIWPTRRLYYLMRAHANGLRVRFRSLFTKNRKD